MVVIPSVLRPVVDSPPIGVKRTAALDSQLAEVVGRLAKVLAPLTLVTTHRQLNRELGRLSGEYLHLKPALWEVVVKELPEEKVIPLVLEAHREMLDMVRRDNLVLGRREKELLTGVLEGLQGLSRAVAQGLDTEQQRTLDVLLECSVPLGRVDMCVSTLIFVLSGEIEQCDAPTIKLLCRAADQYMLEVEDIFLAHSRELGRRQEIATETVSLEQLKREIGLLS